MMRYLLSGGCGLLLGMVLHWTGLSRPEGVRSVLGLRQSYAARSGVYAIGAGMAITALLSWLAVIDVDTIRVYGLHGGVLLGGAVFGVAAGLAGFTPWTAFAGVGGPAPGQPGRALEALCTLAGCLAAVLLPLPGGIGAAVRSWPPLSDATVFRVTLDEPYLLGGGFLGQGCAGVLLMALAACIPGPRMQMLSEEVIAERALLALPAPEPEEASAETFVALLPGEEPLVVDTELTDAEADAEAAAAEEAPQEGEEPLPEGEIPPPEEERSPEEAAPADDEPEE